MNVVISIKQLYPGHAKEILQAASSLSKSPGRLFVVVDDDIDPSNVDDVLWAICTRCDPDTSIDIVRGCISSPLDPRITPDKRAKRDFTNSRALINACRPYEWLKEFPTVNRGSDSIRQQTYEKWKSLFESIRVQAVV